MKKFTFKIQFRCHCCEDMCYVPGAVFVTTPVETKGRLPKCDKIHLCPDCGLKVMMFIGSYAQANHWPPNGFRHAKRLKLSKVHLSTFYASKLAEPYVVTSSGAPCSAVSRKVGDRILADIQKDLRCPKPSKKK